MISNVVVEGVTNLTPTGPPLSKFDGIADYQPDPEMEQSIRRRLFYQYSPRRL